MTPKEHFEQRSARLAQLEADAAAGAIETERLVAALSKAKRRGHLAGLMKLGTEARAHSKRMQEGAEAARQLRDELKALEAAFRAKAADLLR